MSNCKIKKIIKTPFFWITVCLALLIGFSIGLFWGKYVCFEIAWLFTNNKGKFDKSIAITSITGLLSFTGTVALGTVTVYQTHKAHKLNELLINSKAIPAISLDGTTPTLGRADIEIYTDGIGQGTLIKLTIRNISETAITYFGIAKINDKIVVQEFNNSALSINERKSVFVQSHTIKSDEKNFITFELKNAIGDKYMQSFTFTLKSGFPYRVKSEKPIRVLEEI